MASFMVLLEPVPPPVLTASAEAAVEAGVESFRNQETIALKAETFETKLETMRHT